MKRYERGSAAVWVVAAIVAIGLIVAGYYYMSGSRSSGQGGSDITSDNTTSMNTSANDADTQGMTALSKSIYQAFKDKDIDAVMSLAATRNANLAKDASEPVDQFNVEAKKGFQVDMDADGKTEDLLPVDFSTISFVPQADGASYKAQVTYATRKSAKDLVVYLDRDKSLDMTVRYEVYLAKVGGQWAWVK